MRTKDVGATPPPPVWLAAATGLQLMLGRHCRPSRGSRLAAFAIAGGSAVLAARSVAAMRRHGTTISPDHPERTRVLVADGPFALTRNPVYLALTGMLVAHAVLRRSLAMLVPAAGFVAVIDRTQVAREEQALRHRFGKRYDAYRRAVPRWFGTPEA
ncbi:hypothetical protein GCM10022240_12390 [Microbacterium kribbense]|uniref:Isoprenylcysteine carboxylmethyltransferase family protein n=1 Tax=Microbacterium kribbense TaxID=433645 RepID=A0ABP7GC22_9MICO